MTSKGVASTAQIPAPRREQVDHIMERVDRMLDATYGSDDLVMLTAREVAALLGCSLGTVRRRIYDGSLRATRLEGGRAVRISVADLRRYLRK